MSKLTLLVFVVSLLACTYAATKVGNDPIPISDIPAPWYMIPVHPNKQSASLYGDGTSTALEDRKPGFLENVLTTVYSFTLQPIVDIISTALSIMFAPFTYVGSFIGLSKTPPPEKQRSKRQTEYQPEGDTELQFESEPDPGSELDLESTAVQAVDTDSMSNVSMLSMQFIFNIYQYIMGWIDVVIDTLNAADEVNFDEIFALDNVDFDTVMNYIMDVVQEIAIRISSRLWMFMKTDLLPLLDAAIVEIQDSNLFSSDIQQILMSIHAAYQMAHLLDII